MQTGDRQEISESQLIGKSVLDRENHLLGTVISVKDLPNDEFALVVQFPVSETETDDLIIESSNLVAIDPEHQQIHTNLEFNLVVPNRGKIIPLVQEILTVNRHRHKLREVVVRKVTETDWVQIPVYREKLVVQTVGESEAIAEVCLSETRLPPGTEIAIAPGVSHRHDRSESELLGHWQSVDVALQALNRMSEDATLTNFALGVILVLNDGKNSDHVRMEFASPRTAAQLLAALANGWWQQCQEIRLEKL